MGHGFRDELPRGWTTPQDNVHLLNSDHFSIKGKGGHTMSTGVKTLIRPVHLNDGESPPQDLRTRYAAMAADIRGQVDSTLTPSAIKVISEVLSPYAEGRGELVVVYNTTKGYFALDGKAFTNFGVVVLGVIQSHLSDHTQFKLELLIWGQHLPPKIIQVDSKKIHTYAWLDELGPQYFCEKRKIGDLRVLIQAMALFAPVKDQFCYPGWIVDGGNLYMMTGHPVRSADWDVDKARVPCSHVLRMLDVAPHALTIPLLSVALLSLVHSRMVASGTFFKGVCCIVAPTQSFKTTLASLFFDFETGLQADINFEATTAAIVRTIGNTRDKTVIVDDFKPGATKTENNEMVRKLSTVIRMCSDDSGGIQKAGGQNLTVSNIAQALVVVTAEQIQLQVQSTLARLLILEMNRKDVDLEKLTHFQENHGIYRKFIEDFIAHIASQGVTPYCERLAQRFAQSRNALRSELLAENVPIDNRTSDMTTWLWVSFGEFLAHSQQVEAVTPEQFESYTSEARSVFLSVMKQQAERVAELNPVQKFFKGLQVLLDTKEAKLGELQARNSGYAVEDSTEAIGFSKQGFVYLKNGVALQAVATYYRRRGTELSVSESTLRKALADNGYLVSNGDKTHIHRLSVNHKTFQCIKFDKATFYELCNGGEKHGHGQDGELSSDRALQQNADNFLGSGG